MRAGLAAYSTFGAAKGLAFGLAPLPAFGMGVLTGCLGGIIRDVLAGEPSILMRPELYVTVAALSAALLVGLILVGVPGGIAGPIAAAGRLRPARRRDLARLGAARLWALACPDRRNRPRLLRPRR